MTTDHIPTLTIKKTITGEVKSVPSDRIALVDGITPPKPFYDAQALEKIDNEIGQRLSTNQPVEPIQAIICRARLVLLDGHDTLIAANRIGGAHLPAIVYPLDEQDLPYITRT